MQPEQEFIVSAQGQSFSCFSFDQPRFDHPYHFHHEYELCWVQESTGQRIVGDHVADFKAGDLTLFAPGLPHQLRNWQAGRTRTA